VLDPLDEPVFLVSEVPQLVEDLVVVGLKLHVLFPEDDTGLPDDDLLDLESRLLELLLKLEDPPLQIHVLPKRVVSLVLRVFQFVCQLLIESFLPKDLCLQLGDLRAEIVYSVEGGQKRLGVLVVSLGSPSGGNGLQISLILPRCPAFIP
jgi:hypothetical protein